MSSEFNWGIISTGGIAQQFAKDLTFLGNHKVGAVGSRTKESAEKFAATFGGTAYGSYEELVSDKTIDGVYVATPHPYHVRDALLALNAGKPVLCEKPFAISAAEAKSMVDAAKKSNVLLMEAMWTRFLPHIAKIRSIIASGAIGTVHTVEASHCQNLYTRPNPRFTEPNLGGGALMDLGIYPVSFAHLILGVPNKITAKAVLTNKKVDAQTSMIFQYASGAQAVLNCSIMNQSPCKATISGDKGYIEIDGSFYAPNAFRTKINNEFTEYAKDYEGHGLREQAREFERCIGAGLKESPLLTPAETITIMESMDEIRRQIGLEFPKVI